MRQQFDETRIKQDPAAKRVEHARDNERRRAIRIVRVPHAQSGCDAQGKGKSEREGTEPWEERIALREIGGRVRGLGSRGTA